APRAAALARSRDAESETTRRAILAAAEDLLAEGDLSIRQLCARAGVTPPTIYHHFGDKRALVERVIDDCFAEFDQALARRRPPADPLLRDGLIAQLTTAPAGRRARRPRGQKGNRPWHVANRR